MMAQFLQPLEMYQSIVDTLYCDGLFLLVNQNSQYQFEKFIKALATVLKVWHFKHLINNHVHVLEYIELKYQMTADLKPLV